MTDLKTFVRFLFFFVLMSAVSYSQELQDSLEIADHHVVDQAEHHNAGEKFIPGEFIMHHVLDAYEWHIFNYGDFHLSVPLPVIVYSETSGLNILSLNVPLKRILSISFILFVF